MQFLQELYIKVTCLDVGQGHEVLGDVNNKLVHKSRSNVKTVHVVVQVVPETPSPRPALDQKELHLFNS